MQAHQAAVGVSSPLAAAFAETAAAAVAALDDLIQLQVALVEQNPAIAEAAGALGRNGTPDDPLAGARKRSRGGDVVTPQHGESQVGHNHAPVRWRALCFGKAPVRQAPVLSRFVL